MTVRRAEIADAEDIASLINLAFVVESFFIDGDRTGAAEVGRLMGIGAFWLIGDDTGLAACVYVELLGERAYLGLLSVAPPYQGKGFSRRLVEVAEDVASKAGCKFMDLRMVNLRVDLPAFYRKLGYRETGTAPFPPEAPAKMPCHFVLMSKPLDSAP
jgi:GNAT superfamily N-acetyltransferase